MAHGRGVVPSVLDLGAKWAELQQAAHPGPPRTGTGRLGPCPPVLCVPVVSLGCVGFPFHVFLHVLLDQVLRQGVLRTVSLWVQG